MFVKVVGIGDYGFRVATSLDGEAGAVVGEMTAPGLGRALAREAWPTMWSDSVGFSEGAERGEWGRCDPVSNGSPGVRPQTERRSS